MAVLNRHSAVRAVLLTLLSALVAAQDDSKPFDCHFTLSNLKYDLTKLAGEHSLLRELPSPPSTIEEKVTFNLCEDLKHNSEIPDEDQCPSGTRACLVRTTHKGGQDGLVTSVVPLANSSADAVTYESLSSPKGVRVTFAGASYPSPMGAEPILQHLHLKLLCDQKTSNVNFTSYDGKDLWLEWQAPAGCPFGGPPDEDTKKPDDGGDDDSGKEKKKEESVGSGIGYFFLLFFLALAAYFVIGAYYNYSTYGASGADLIPHRDFWREVPYMLRDLVSHICSAVRPRQSSSRGGYIAV